MSKITSICLVLFHIVCGGLLLMAQNSPAAASNSASSVVIADGPVSVALLDVLSSTFDQANIRIFTDVLRTSLFKTAAFKIIDRGVILDAMQKEGMIIQKGEVDDTKVMKVGKALQVKKILLLSINNTSGTVVLNVRLIDVASSVLDYTDNVFITDQSQIFSAIQNLVTQLAQRQSQNDQPQGAQADKIVWQKYGASAEDAAWLVQSGHTVNEYLDLRQFDVDFTVSDFIAIAKEGRDLRQLRQFFLSGIRFSLAKQAFALNITNTAGYEARFKEAKYSFAEYLEAYKAGILDPKDFVDYKNGYRKIRIGVGIGGVADNVPIANASAKFAVVTVEAEYFFTDYQRDIFKASTEVGIYFLDIIGITPYLQLNAYLGKYPFYLKAGTGVLAEVILGGHVGWYVKAGIEAFEHIEISFLTAITGTQPSVSYSDLKTREGEPGYYGIKFPYYALFITYKF